MNDQLTTVTTVTRIADAELQSVRKVAEQTFTAAETWATRGVDN
jgi:hypothetical protein